MYYTIYKTTNKFNGKFYIGKHQTQKLNDNYLGSGKALELAIKKYGKENFQKRIIFVFDNEILMNQKEKEIVTENFISSNTNYNCGVGGEGGAQFLNKSHSEKTKKLLAEKAKLIKPSKETRDKISEGNRKRTLSKETRNKLSQKSFERWKKLRVGENSHLIGLITQGC
jgi:hypothetical protein